MELRHPENANRARFLWPLAAIGLVVVALLVAGGAQAGSGPTASEQRLARSQDRSAALATANEKLSARHKRQSRQVDRLTARLERKARAAERLKARVERAKRASAADDQRLAEVRDAAGEPLSLTGDACEQNVALAASHGLRLPDGWAIHCVGPGLDWEGGSHWGVTCPYDDCPEGAGPYVSISNPTYYVVAHELCHANFGNDELMADACAAEHGASLETSPYG
ncbi:MAG: hypothetical protein M3550_12485 [Actinomycetota bacterium]|nr:hypothetical protein [Actinomycetota bacterium]